MFLLSKPEIERWASFATRVRAVGAPPDEYPEFISRDLFPAFCYHVGTVLASEGELEHARAWFRAGIEGELIPASGYMLDFIDRYGDMIIPDITFSDPGPWNHFSSLEPLVEARESFLTLSVHSLPRFDEPLQVMDVGCGSGALAIEMIGRILSAGKAKGVDEVTLIDPSRGMLELAERNFKEAYPEARLVLVNDRLERVSDQISPGYDISIASSSVHHMPREDKVVHLGRLGRAVDHFLLLELEGNHDVPELHSPELTFSVFQIFGRGVEFVFAQDGPDDVRRASADLFLMTEAISILTEPRGRRSEYHMLRRQWRDLLDDIMGPALSCMCDSTCYSDPYVEQMFLHYGR